MVRLGPRLAKLVGALVVLVAGCLGGPTGSPDAQRAGAGFAGGVQPLWLADEAGDEDGFSVAALNYGPSCRIGCERLPVPLPDAAGPAPFLDIRRVGLAAEAADSFTVVLELGALEPGFAALDDAGATHRIAEYYACWEPRPDLPTRCVILLAAPSKAGAVLLSTFNLFGPERCGGWKECAWDVPVTVTYGSPGQLRFEVPKAYATWDGAPADVHNLRAETGWFSTNKAAPLWHFAWTVRVPGNHEHDHMGLVEPAGVADVTAASPEVRHLAPRHAAPAVEAAAPLMTPGAGTLLGAGGLRDYPELDLVGLDMREEGEELVVAFRMAALAAMPAYDLQIALLLELDSGHDWEVGVMQSNGVAYGYAGRCVSFGCHDAFLNRTPLAVAHDAFEIRVPLQTLGNPAKGVQTTWLLVYTMYGEANQDVGPGGEDGSANLHSGSLVDAHVGGRPFVFAGHGEPVDVGHEH